MDWCPIWSYHFQNYESLPAVVAGITQITRIVSVVDAKKVRLLFSNENGKYDVVFRDGKFLSNHKARCITWNGSKELLLHPGETKLTDELDVSVKKGEVLSVEVKPEGLFTGYAGFNSASFFHVKFQKTSGEGIHPSEFSEVVRKPFNSYVCFGIRGIEVLTENKPEIITVFGDSLVHQGHWFQEMYQKSFEQNEMEVFVNEGISGNRVLHDANTNSSVNSVFGMAGIRRLKRDVFFRYHPGTVIIAEGINDLIHPGTCCPKKELPTSEELIWGLKELGNIVKNNGSQLILATLSPFYGYDQSWNEQKEKIRQEVNAWIREQELVLDIDKYVRDEEKNMCLCEAFDSGDHLHFNQLAGKKIAERWTGNEKNLYMLSRRQI